MTTIIDVAKRAKVSPATVSNAFNKPGRVGKATLERVLSVAAEMNFQPNLMAHGLRSQKTGIVGIVVSDIRIAYTAQIAKGAQDRLRQAGKTALITNVGHDQASIRSHLLELRQQGIRAFVMAPAPYRYDEETRELILQMLNDGMHMSFVSNELASFPADVVLWQAQEGAKTLVNHFAKLGHEKIAFVRLPLNKSTAGLKRWLGYQEGMHVMGLPLRDEYVFEGTLDFESGVRAANYLLNLPDPPTAILANDDLMASGVINRCYHMGIKIPADLSIAGFSSLDMAQHLSPALTTVGVSLENMGRSAAELLLERLDEPGQAPRKIHKDYELIIRESTGEVSGKEKADEQHR
ncbi:MAG: LacI family DNA-binding transcriptional regulator [Chloroflexota bacterium]